MVQFQWHSDRQAVLALAQGFTGAIAARDEAIARCPAVEGHCPVCRRPTSFAVGTGAMFGPWPNLREGLRCAHCRLTARQRLVFLAMEQHIDASPVRRGALLEQTTLLYRHAHARWPWLTGSEYLGERRISGRHYWWSARGLRWRRLRHESITRLSYPAGSLDLLVHSDVLEHVYELDLALREGARVLRDGGVMLFTVPFFLDRSTSLLRGRPRADGSIEHIEAPEYHGDGVRRQGIYTFHSLGWDFPDRVRAAGFARLQFGLCHAPDEGLTAADPCGPAPRLGVPLVFRATR
ncbi:methyltransferase domain-containing protein [Frateuria sp.]|uniref:class I SAM-dependent methyltransferase n=1 Tax=Frateuria sp. TaxID=2211372 RepID=UPI0017DDEFEE|nr:methyltransferase domain-containing protein [Frateuria sp.]NUR22755.1 methyltransferase domain-containing protein [Frateuria sp.]